MIHAIAVGLARRQGDGPEIPVGEARWSGDDLPDGGRFAQTVMELYERVELPNFPATVWTSVDTPFASRRLEEADAVDDPRAVAARLWTWIQAVGHGHV